MIDSHTHLTSCREPEAELVAQAERNGVRRMLTIGTDADSCRAALRLAEDFPQVYVGIGRHPNSATGFDAADLADLRALAAHPRCRAIGETGLDFYRDNAPEADQRRAFSAHVALARETAKPLVIHTRAADQQTLDLLGAEADGVRVIMHCFSMPDRLDECVERGYWISFAGNVTYPANAELRAAAARVPEDRILVETDAPYLSPQPVRKERNVPANVVLTAEAIATERGVSYAELERAVEQNAAELFGW
ncbi:TatD family hydrolase [Conexibacter arvalis]|uniref:TatD DNase family protein n=1 Tax=Conexibacter arvalis TaxID=912552 RepID=A0A840IA46_9ACTN|nr:TatD family hydrolase [Conexibacter arvalis]MBB4661716.1 TatD DNase family protein [Conexibacter arvalis]